MKLKAVENLEAEVRKLEHELRVELPKEIKKALEFGDLRENAEYHAALERQEHIRIRLGSMQDRLRRLTMVNPAAIPKDKVGYGATVVVIEEGKDGTSEMQFVTSEEADADKGLVSVSSPIGRAFMGKEVGDEVEVKTPGGMRQFEIQDLKTIHDG